MRCAWRASNGSPSSEVGVSGEERSPYGDACFARRSRRGSRRQLVGSSSAALEPLPPAERPTFSSKCRLSAWLGGGGIVIDRPGFGIRGAFRALNESASAGGLSMLDGLLPAESGRCRASDERPGVRRRESPAGGGRLARLNVCAALSNIASLARQRRF